jgi:hypothetical protein
MEALYSINKRCVVGVFVVGMFAAMPSRGEAQEQAVVADGQREYQQHCAVCHAPSRKGGDGMKQRNFLKIPPADLTCLRARNKGQFLFWRVYDVIDGRLAISNQRGASQSPEFKVLSTEN